MISASGIRAYYFVLLGQTIQNKIKSGVETQHSKLIASKG